MKKIILSGLLLLALISVGMAQDTTSTWVTQNGNPVLGESAAYLRKVWQEDVGLWQVRQYYVNGVLQMKGTYSNPLFRTKDGVFSYYAPNGTKRAEGRYEDDVALGVWTSWFDNGALSDQGKYLREISAAERDSLEKREFYNQRPRHWESVKDSIWVYYHRNGVRSAVEQYRDGKLLYEQYWNADGSEAEPGTEVYRPATFPGGIGVLWNFLATNIRYPRKAGVRGYSGTVIVSFVIDESGKACEFAVVQTVHPELDREALRLVKSMPPWEPALAQNRFVKMIHHLPVKFKM